MGVRRQTEKGFLAAVRRYARLHNWREYHTHDSRRSAAGWPDLVLCKPPRILFVELKTDVGKETVAQGQWLAMLLACGLDARLWRPRDWEEIERVLGGAS